MAGKTPTTDSSGDHPAAGAGSDVRFLHDIEALSKALSLNPPSKSRQLNQNRQSNPNPPRSSSVRSSPNPNPKSFFLKSLKSLSHFGQRKFDCVFTLHVASIESLPTSLEGSALSVHFQPASSASAPPLATRPVKATRGTAHFGETLTFCSSIYAKSSSSKTLKYESRQLSIHVTCGGADLGRNTVDLTRVMPLTLAELEAERKEEGEERGKWSASFRLTGRARGAKLNMNFGYLLVCENEKLNLGKAPALVKMEQRDSKAPALVKGEQREKRLGEILNEKLGKVESKRSVNNFARDRARSRSIEDVRLLHEVRRLELPVLDFKKEVERAKESKKEGFEGVLCKFEEKESSSPERKHCTEFTVVEQGVEVEIDKKDQEEIVHKAEGLIERNVAVEMKDQEEIVDKTEGVIERNDEVELESKDEGEINNKIEGTIERNDEIEAETKDQGEKSEKTEGVTEKDAKEENLSFQESEDDELKELESIFENLSFLEPDGFQSPNLDKTLTLTHEAAGPNPNFTDLGNLKRSKSLDAQTETVASEFLSMLGLDFSPFGLSSDSDPESPREKLLRQFEKESLATEGGLFGLDFEEQGVEIPDFSDPGIEIPGFSQSGIEIQGFTEPGIEIPVPKARLSYDFQVEEYHESGSGCRLGIEIPVFPESGNESPVSKAKLMEDLETEALMRQFGIDENSFLSSNNEETLGFGSPIQVPLEDPPLEPPPLGENLGLFIQTESGGFLRSMNPQIFKNYKNGGNLVMQSSSPVVLPAEMGGGVMDILQNLAGIGIEKLSAQASKIMPLEDFEGKNVEQIAWGADRTFYDRQAFLESTCSKLDASSSTKPNNSSDYVSLDELAPLAMEKIEALSMEGLRIQCGLSDQSAPSNIQSRGATSAIEGPHGTGALQLLDLKGLEATEDDSDGLMGLSLSLNEWMRLDCGLIEEGENGGVSDRTARVLAAHHAKSVDLVRDGPKKKGGKKCGLLENNFTVAIMVQLRDPVRNFEPVGTPMLALIQVERVFVPPKPKIYGNVTFKVSNDVKEEQESKNESESMKTEVIEVPQYKITEVHVAGFENREMENRELKSGKGNTEWGGNREMKSGSRWLLAAGMGKGSKNPLLKSKGSLKSGKEDSTLWSVSSKVSSGKFGRNANILLGKR